MTKYLRYARWVVIFSGGIGMLLRLWLLLGGTDERGLYPAWHISQILLLPVTAATLAFLLLTRHTGSGGHFSVNFPPSVLAAAGNWIAALALVWVNVRLLGSQSDLLTCIGGILGLLSAVSLGAVGRWRRKGKEPGVPAHLLPCLYFLVLSFLLARQFGSEPELTRFLPQFFAAAASALASYQLWGFDIGAGNRRKSLFWSLTAGYFCMIATPDGGILYAALALWHLTGHCALQSLPRRAEEATVREPQADMPPLTQEDG